MKSSRSAADLQFQVEELRSEALCLKKSQNQLLQEAALARIRERKLQDELRRAQTGTTAPSRSDQREADEMNRALQAELDRVRKRNSALQEQVRKFADSGARKTPRIRRKTPRLQGPAQPLRPIRNENTVVHPDEIQVLLDRLGDKLTLGSRPIQEPMPRTVSEAPSKTPNPELAELKARLRDSQTKVLILERQYDQLEAALQAGKQVQRGALDQIDHYKALLADANTRHRQAQGRVKELEFFQDQVEALQIVVDDLKATNTNLQTQIDTLTESAFIGDQAETRRLKAVEVDHQAKLSDLRAALAQRDADQQVALDKAQEQSDRIRQLGDELAHVQSQCDRAERAECQAQARIVALQDRVDVFTSESGVDLDVLDRALDLVRRQSRTTTGSRGGASGSKEPMTIGDLQRRVRDLEILNKDLVEEIRNKDDVLRIQTRLHTDLDAAYNRLLEEHGHLKQMYDQERHQSAIRPRPESVLSDLSLLSQASLNSFDGDRNLVAIRVVRANLDQSGPRFRDMNTDPLTFITIDFFDFETCYSGVFTGFDPSYRLTAQFQADIDPLFLGYLQRGSMTIDLYRQGERNDADLIGRCRIGLVDLLGHRQRLRGTFSILDIADSNLTVGTLQIVCKMFRPVVSPAPSVTATGPDAVDDDEIGSAVISSDPRFLLRLTLALLHVPVETDGIDLHVQNTYYDLDIKAERISTPDAPSATFTFEFRTCHDRILPHEVIDLKLMQDGVIIAIASLPLTPVAQATNGIDDIQLALRQKDGTALGAGTVRLDWALIEDV